jgi:hypothetical protein
MMMMIQTTTKDAIKPNLMIQTTSTTRAHFLVMYFQMKTSVVVRLVVLKYITVTNVERLLDFLDLIQPLGSLTINGDDVVSIRFFAIDSCALWVMKLDGSWTGQTTCGPKFELVVDGYILTHVR